MAIVALQSDARYLVDATTCPAKSRQRLNGKNGRVSQSWHEEYHRRGSVAWSDEVAWNSAHRELGGTPHPSREKHS